MDTRLTACRFIVEEIMGVHSRIVIREQVVLAIEASLLNGDPYKFYVVSNITKDLAFFRMYRPPTSTVRRAQPYSKREVP